MKIAWVTPFNERSAIGRVSGSVAAELIKRGHEVLVVRSEQDRSLPLGTYAKGIPTAWWDDVLPHEIDRRFDVIALAVGDHYQYHAGLFHFLDAATCLGIFHDLCIVHLFTGWLGANGGSEALLNREITGTYGESVLPLAGQFMRGEADLPAVVERMPMLEWVSARCGGALAHASFYTGRLAASCPGPVGVASLSQEPRDVPPLPERSPDEPVTITTVGFVNPNKCADAVIEAIGRSDVLRQRTRYRLVGPIIERERERLSGLAQSLGVTGLDILGEVDEAVLEAELARADIVCCLRRPVFEGASASAIEALMCGRPVIVADAGFYGELPDDYVFKVPAHVDRAILSATLERLVLDEPLRRTVGERARDWSRATFTTERYVASLEDVLKRFVAAKPHLALARRLGNELAGLGLTPTDPALERIAGRMQALLAPVPPSP